MKRIAPIVLLLASVVSCAPYARHTADIRAALQTGDYPAARERIGKAAGNSNKLLFYLEHGTIAHTRGDYDLSNRYFETAERVADHLFTRSITREAAALVTNDEVRRYRGEPFERVFINYYRALNYWHLGQFEDALVECRKANLKLSEYTGYADSEASYRSDAFIHYLTALMYEAIGDLNDAYVSLKHARKGYQAYAERFGMSPPPSLEQDFIRIVAQFGDMPEDSSPVGFSIDSTDGELVLLSEVGFVPRRVQEELNLPIYDNDIKLTRRGRENLAAQHVIRRHYRRSHHSDVNYWLRVAIPRLESTPKRTTRVKVSAGDLQRQARSEAVEDLDAISRATLADKHGAILARTVARGIVKYITTESIKDENRVLGWLANLFTAATEKADTRSWVSLPGSIHLSRLTLPSGEHDIVIETIGRGGHTVERKTLERVKITAGERTFVNHRFYE
tara:strand:+ start:1973 stop:3322 length:1350 start_codon:yes stop_codon:yes gene_type:complete